MSTRESEVMEEQKVMRLNWGCGDWREPGWINSDIKEGDGILTCDIREGLPFDDDSLDYAVSIHSLPEIPYPELVPALRELRRVIKPGGVLRVGLPDLEKGIDAYRRGDRGYFKIPDDEVSSVGGKLIVQLLWYGYSRTLFTSDFICEMLLKAGFREAYPCAYKQTRCADPRIVELDNREDESLFAEGVK